MRSAVLMWACVVLMVGNARAGDDRADDFDTPPTKRPSLPRSEPAAVPEESTPAPRGTSPTPVLNRSAVRSVATPVPASSGARRAAIEQTLQAPLGWNADGRKTITLLDLIEHVRATHQLSIRLDLPTLSAMYGPMLEQTQNAAPSEKCCPAGCPATKPASGKSASPPALKQPSVKNKAVAPSPPVPVVAYRPGAAARKDRPASSTDNDTSPSVPSLVETYAREADTVATNADETDVNSNAPTASPLKPAKSADKTSAVRQTAGTVESLDDEPNSSPVVSPKGVKPSKLVDDPVQPAELDGPARGTVDDGESERAVAKPPLEDGPAALKPGTAPASSDKRAASAKIPTASPSSVWVSDYEAGVAEARRRDVPLLVYFRVDWCGPCQTLERGTLNDPKVVRLLRREFVPVRVDLDSNAQLAKRFNVTTLPTLLVVEADGKARKSHVGIVSAADLKTFLGAAMRRQENDGSRDQSANAGDQADEVVTCPGCPNKESAACDDETGGVLAFSRIAVPVEALGLEGATVGTALSQMLSSITAALGANGESILGEEVPLPIRLTNASDLDYLVQDDGVLVTSRLNANIRKETRVYRMPTVADCPPEKLARLITRSVRPWSWRSQVNDMAEGLASKWSGGFRLPSSFNLDLGNGVKVASGQTKAPSKPKGTSPVASPAPGGASLEDGESVSNAANALSAETLNALGQFVIHGGATIFQAWLAAIEVAHHADPPTGNIETLPGLLIITQSQGAHREIADLLQQLNGELEKSPSGPSAPKSTFSSTPDQLRQPNTAPYDPPPSVKPQKGI